MRPQLYLNFPLSAVAPNHESTERALKNSFERLNRTQTISLLAKLNLISSGRRLKENDTLHNEQMECLTRMRNDGYFTKTLVDKLLKYINKFSRSTPGYPVIFSRPSLFEAIRWASVWCDDSISPGRLQRSDHLQKSLLESILISGEFIFSRQSQYLNSNQDQLSKLDAAAQEAARRQAQPMMRLMMDFSPLTREPLLFLGRARMLLIKEFFEKNPEYLDEFASRYSNLSVADYIICAAVFMLTTTNKLSTLTRGMGSDLEIKTDEVFMNATHLQESFQNYLKFKSQDSDELAIAFKEKNSGSRHDFLSLKIIREKPILLDSNGNAVILDTKLFVESVSVGPLFMLLNNDKKHDRAVFAAFGLACHRYAFHLIKSCKFSTITQDYQTEAIVEEPKGKHIFGQREERSLGDVAIIDVAAVCLVEIKGTWFKEIGVETPDKFWKEVYKSYGVSKEANGEENRLGYAQLADAIKLLSLKKVEPIGEAVSIKNVSTIHPVLLIHDELMLAPNFAHLLHLDFLREFEQEPTESGCFTFEGNIIHSLILLTFSELEDFQSRQHSKSINSYLSEYSAWSPNRSESFGDFISDNYRTLKPLDLNLQIVRQSAIEGLDDVAKRAFKNKIL